MKTKIKCIFIAFAIFLLLLMILLIHPTTIKNQNTKNISITNVTTTPISTKNLSIQTSYVTIKNFTYSTYFENISWSNYTSYTCNLSDITTANSIYCDGVTTLINTTNVKLTLFFKNSLNNTMYINQTPIQLFGFKSHSTCSTSTVKPFSEFNCTVIFQNKNLLPGSNINNNFNFYYCNKICNNSNIYTTFGYSTSYLIPSKNNIPFNYTYEINLTKATNTTYNYSGPFVTPSSLKLENILSLNRGFIVKNIIPQIPINFTADTPKTIYIALQFPNNTYTGNVALKLVYSN